MYIYIYIRFKLTYTFHFNICLIMLNNEEKAPDAKILFKKLKKLKILLPRFLYQEGFVCLKILNCT